MAAREFAADLRGCYAAALEAADPARAVRDGFRSREVTLELGRDRPHWIIALGKAAPAMAEAAFWHCAQMGLTVAGGLVIGAGPTAARAPAPGIESLVGDHPVPGVRSSHAAERLLALVERVGRADVVLLLLSGGTSSLVGAPIDGVRVEDLASLHALLLGAGVPIGRVNAVRKRFSRWGAGRLAAALECERVIPILLADVPNEDPAMIGSGPVSPDGLQAWHVERILRDAGIAVRVPLSVASTLGAMRAGVIAETPKAGSPAFARVEEPFVVGNTAALDAAAAHAHALGYAPVLLSRTVLSGDATAAGRVLAHTLARAAPGSCLIWGGETTVRLPDDHGLGGRAQQLALAAAEVIDETRAVGAWLLAAGTDGRDGPSSAAGALVHADTWRESAARGGFPARALGRCDAFGALDAAGALIPARETGTNVMDIVVAVRG
jgi:hydroxypyruvate reductase